MVKAGGRAKHATCFRLWCSLGASQNPASASPPRQHLGLGPGLAWGLQKLSGRGSTAALRAPPPGTRPPCAAPGGARALSLEREPPAAGGLPRPTPRRRPPAPPGRPEGLPAARQAYCSAVTRNGCRSAGPRRPEPGRGRGGLPTPTAPRGAARPPGGRGTSASPSPPLLGTRRPAEGAPARVPRGAGPPGRLYGPLSPSWGPENSARWPSAFETVSFRVGPSRTLAGWASLGLRRGRWR